MKYPTISELVKAYNEGTLGEGNWFLWSNSNWTKETAQGMTTREEIEGWSQLAKEIIEKQNNAIWAKSYPTDEDLLTNIFPNDRD